jgi:hypothetical protein
LNDEQLAGVFEAVRVMPLRPSDVLVFRSNVRLNAAQESTIRAHLEEKTGHARIVILDSAADLGVLRPEPEPEPAPWWKFWRRHG